MNDLELATIDDLVAELLRRETFCGIVVRQAEDFKGQKTADWRWDSRNCVAAGILRRIIPHMESQHGT